MATCVLPDHDRQFCCNVHGCPHCDLLQSTVQRASIILLQLLFLAVVRVIDERFPSDACISKCFIVSCSHGSTTNQGANERKPAFAHVINSRIHASFWRKEQTDPFFCLQIERPLCIKRQNWFSATMCTSGRLNAGIMSNRNAKALLVAEMLSKKTKSHPQKVTELRRGTNKLRRGTNNVKSKPCNCNLIIIAFAFCRITPICFVRFNNGTINTLLAQICNHFII